MMRNESSTRWTAAAALLSVLALVSCTPSGDKGTAPTDSTAKAATAPPPTVPAATTATAATDEPADVPSGGPAQYVGVKKCSKCHKSETKGNQFGKWQTTKHASAFKELSSPKAKELGKKAGVDDPSTSEKCLKCHVTAYGVDKALLGADFDPKDGVQCESCHGPGSNYDKKSLMEDKKKAVAAGLIIPDEKVCVKCHNKESPAYKEFHFKDFYEKIKHEIPKK